MKGERKGYELNSSGNRIIQSRVRGNGIKATGPRRTYVPPEGSRKTTTGNFTVQDNETTTMPGIQIRSKNYEQGRTQGEPIQAKYKTMGEANVKKFVSPNSKYPYSTNLSSTASHIGQAQQHPASNSRTPMRPTNIQTKHLQNILSRGYSTKQQGNFLTSPSTQIGQHGERIVIKSDKKRVRKSNYDGPVSVQAQKNYEGAIKQSGIYTSRTQVDGKYVANQVRKGSIGANMGSHNMVGMRTNGMKKVSSRRVDTSGLSSSNHGDSGTYRKKTTSEVHYQMTTSSNGGQTQQVMHQYNKSGSTRISIGKKQVNTQELGHIIQKFTPIKGNLRKQTRPSNKNPNLQFYNQGQNEQVGRKWGSQAANSETPQKENLRPEQPQEYEHSEKTRASRADVMDGSHFETVPDRRDERIKELEMEVEELKEIIAMTNKDKNLALKFNQILLERLDEYDETPPSSSARE